jgi:hypothetical protein
MRRIHGVELSDLEHFPRILRDASMAFLRQATAQTGQHVRLLPVVESALKASGDKKILDLCSGGGGPIFFIAEELAKGEAEISLTLSDYYPNEGARYLAETSSIVAHYEDQSVDARSVSPNSDGLRTIINAFHHFRPPDARQILASAVASRQAICVIEIVRRNLLTALAILGTPIHVFLIIPRLRPFRWAWLPLTYIVPVIPFVIFWDAMMSCFRTYSREELNSLVRAADPEGSFEWTIEEPKILGPIRGIALTGIPNERLVPVS